jgi:hypothetical protein
MMIHIDIKRILLNIYHTLVIYMYKSIYKTLLFIVRVYSNAFKPLLMRMYSYVRVLYV